MGFSNGLVSPWIKSLIKNLVKKEDRKKRKYYVTQVECYQKIRCIGTFEMVDHKARKRHIIYILYGHNISRLP